MSKKMKNRWFAIYIDYLVYYKMATEQQIIKVASSDERIFEVSKDVISMSTVIKNVIEDVGVSNDPIPLPNVTGDIMEKIIQFCEYHTVHPEVNVAEYMTTGKITDPWDITFCEMPMDVKIDVINATNYLDIKQLLDMLCLSVAHAIKGKSPAEIRQIMCGKIVDDTDDTNNAPQ